MRHRNTYLQGLAMGVPLGFVTVGMFMNPGWLTLGAGVAILAINLAVVRSGPRRYPVNPYGLPIKVRRRRTRCTITRRSPREWMRRHGFGE